MSNQSLAHPFLSIVIPALNEEQRLPASLDRVVDYVNAKDFAVEVVVINNNSKDRTGEIISEYAAQFPFIRGVFEEAPGKGAAVRTGMLAAQGDFRFICDADLSMPIAEVDKFLPPNLTGCDIAIGSREAPGAVRYNEPWHRHLMGRVFNTIVRWFAVPGLQDTQCGFKMFSSTATENLFPLQTMDGWSFDVEILYAAHLWGYKIVEVPINWYYGESSRISPISDSLDMFIEVFKIRRNGQRGLYQPPETNDPTTR